jgi:hypothetical protein
MNMKFKTTLFATALLNAALALPLTMAVGATNAVDPAVGTWTLNLAKSKPDAASPTPKRSVRTYSATADGLTVVIDTVGADGATHELSSTFSYDGKQHPVTGATDYDTIAVTRMGPRKSKTDMIRGGQTVGHLTRVVSKDGKTMTITSDLTSAKGEKLHDVAVYDRQ